MTDDTPSGPSPRPDQATLVIPLVRRKAQWPDLSDELRLTPGRLPAGWPLFAALVMFPLWWALGLGSFVFPIFAIPMAVQLARRPAVKVPPWFWLWGLFVVWSMAGVVMLSYSPPGTLTTTTADGLDAFVLRTLQYLAATVVLLYVGNLTEAEVPRLRIIRWLGVLFVVTLIGGFVGLLFPTLNWTSLVERLLPGALSERRGLQQLVHPAVAQIQNVIGQADARPKAPFEYTNAWGNNLSILLLWFVIGSLIYASSRRRTFASLALVVALVPIIYSLNRGLWLGLTLAGVYVAVRLAMAGRPQFLAAFGVGAALLVVIIAVTPLGTVFTERLNAGHSNQVRTSLSSDAFTLALQSPVLGYGGTRDKLGSEESIAIGATADCPRCGNRTIGSNGHFWNVLFAQGFVGALLFVGWYLANFWHYRRDLTPIGLAGQAVVVMTLLYMFAYVGISSSLSLVMVSIGLLWRNEQVRRSDPRAIAPTDEQVPA